MSAAAVDRRPTTDRLARAAGVVGRPRTEVGPPYAVGVDLGTASTVLVVEGADRTPVLVETHPSGALRDGVVVDFVGAAEVVAGLRRRAEAALGVALPAATTAHPPGVPRADQRTCGYVLERAGFLAVDLLDEVSAANRTLAVRDGVVVDVGGGSTGVGVIVAGELVRTDDRPGGGQHLDLILAGALGIGTAEAERRKRRAGREYLGILRPGIERIAVSIRRMLGDDLGLPVHVAGGALLIDGAPAIVAEVLGTEVHTYPHAELITPLGIAEAAHG